mgnify:FL=1
MKKIKKEYYFISILLILFIILTIFVLNDKTLSLDTSAFNNLIKIKNESLSKILFIITNIGSTIGTVIALIITCIIFLKRKIFSDFKYVFLNVSVGVILMQVIKSLIRRVRPSWKWIVQGGFSYPSGHTITAILFYGTLILLVNKKLKGKYKTILTVLLSLMIFLIAISRIYFGAHYLTDVLASIILGSAILIISNSLMNKEFKNDKNRVKE